MSFVITGYVLEPPRVGQSNSPFTSTPNNFVDHNVPANVAAYNAAYPTSETNPRDDYLVIVTAQDVNPQLIPLPPNGPAGLLVNAGFGWTKNEIVQRFDYDSHGGRFKPLPGGPPTVVGALGPASNTNRLKAKPPLQFLAAAPYRLSIGSSGSGITQTVVLVPLDSSFGTPPPGTTELSQESGKLNWNTTDLVTYNGQTVRWQQQQFFRITDTGNIGALVLGPLAPAILLSPIPGHGQIPLLRFGFTQPWLVAVEKPDEAHFTPFPGPSSGTVEWALTTGRLNFSNHDVTVNVGVSVYYDGILFARDLTLPRQDLGPITSPSAITLPNPTTGDLIFCVPDAAPFYQFPSYQLLTPSYQWNGSSYVLVPPPFDPIGTQGTVQVKSTTGAVQFSLVDQALFSTPSVLNVTVVYGDLLIDHGVSIRLFRTTVNLDASGTSQDVTNIYEVQNAVWAKPITASPVLFLPSTPLNNTGLQVTVNQGTGTFTGLLIPVDTANPTPSLGYFINFETNQLTFAQRKNFVLVPILQSQSHVSLPDSLVLTSNIVLSIETGPGTAIYTPLTPGVDCLVEGTPGIIDFITTVGLAVSAGSAGTFSGTTFTDSTANYVAEGVLVGDYLVVKTGYAIGVYTIIAIPSTTTLTVDVAPPAGVGPLAYQVLRGKEILLDRYFQPVQPTDPTTSVERIRSLGTIKNATIIHDSGITAATFPNLNTLSDLSEDFTVDNVQPGDTIALPSGAITPTSTLRLVLTSTQHTLTPSSSFTAVTASTYSVSRRLQIPISAIGTVRFRFGQTTYSTVSDVHPVANDGLFSNPATLAKGVVEVSRATGNLNFSQADVAAGGTVYWVRRLALGIDYQTQPQLGLFQFTTRLLQNEEVLLTYTQAPPPPALGFPPANSNQAPPPPAVPILFANERGTFLVRKELTEAHPTPTNTLFFNPAGKSVATNPPARVFRGGRPQITSPQVGGQVTINPGNPPAVPSSITFLPDNILTDALPHGPIVTPDENVYIDYYIFQAMGGERTLTVLNPPLQVPQVSITDGDNSFIISGDQRLVFPSGFILRVNDAEIYHIGTVTFDPVANKTTVTLSGTQLFQSDEINPNLFVASGPTPLTSAPLVPAYFTTELQSFGTIPRGSPSFTLPTDRTGTYVKNTVVYFTDGSFTEFYIVTGSSYVAFNTGGVFVDLTTVTLSGTTLQQYTSGPNFLSYSVRPIVEQATSITHTINPLVAGQPVTVFRRVAGQIGQILTAPTDYSIDSSGTVVFKPPALLPNEEFSIFYTGQRFVPAGIRLQANYSCTIVPDDNTNGLLGQVLNANYQLFSPDSFYYRVETMTNFKGEVSTTLLSSVTSGTTSSGPMTSNTAAPTLPTQGQPSLWFPEGHLPNVDIINRICLKFFNDAVNYLEDVLHAIDGRIVGDAHGRFLFDANLNNPVRNPLPLLNYATITNQIDDLLLPPFPLPPDFPLALLPIFEQPIYATGPYSRFFKTVRNTFATTAVTWTNPSPPDDGTPISQFNWSNLTALPEYTFKRAPRAQIQFDYPAGSSYFIVDNANASNDNLSRPAFTDGAITPRIRILAPDGTLLLPDAIQAVVVAISPSLPFQQTITISQGAPVDIPAGSTITTSVTDADNRIDSSQNGYSHGYKVGHEINITGSTGVIGYRNREFPFNGIFDFFPPINPIGFFFNPLDINPVQFGDILEMDGCGVGVTNTTPYEFPALKGSTTDDDGNQNIPIVGPTLDGELIPGGGGALNVEAINEPPTSGYRALITTPPFVGTGSLDATRTIITLSAGLFAAPAPMQYDLVRIVSGANGQTSWRRIQSVQNSVAPASVTVLGIDAFAVVDTNFQFAVTISSVNVSGACTFPGPTLLEDLHALFVPLLFPVPPEIVPMAGAASVRADASVQHPGKDQGHRKYGSADMYGHSSVSATADVISPPIVSQIASGWTVLMTSGPNTGLRRQILAVITPFDLLLESPFPIVVAANYRICNPLDTYDGPAYTQLVSAVVTELSTILTRTPPVPPPYVPNASSEQNALLSFFSTVFTNVVGPSTHGAVSGTTLTDTTVDFLASKVNTSYLVYVHVGSSGTQLADMGVYQITTVVDAHHLTLTQTIPTAGTVTYEIVRIFGTTYKTLNKIFSILVANATFVAQTQSFQSVLSTHVPVLRDAGAFAVGLQTAGDDLGTRYAQVNQSTGRLGYLATTNPNSPITIIQGALKSSDQLYSKRFSWIDARINLQTGTLTTLAQAVITRITSQVQVTIKLIQLLTVQAS